MSRVSKDHFDAQGNLVDGYDYDLQVWVLSGYVQECGHMNKDCGCNARIYAGQLLTDVRKHSVAAKLISKGTKTITAQRLIEDIDKLMVFVQTNESLFDDLNTNFSLDETLAEARQRIKEHADIMFAKQIKEKLS